MTDLPVPAAAEDQPAWYTILARIVAGERPDWTTVQAAAIAATADHDARSAELARLGGYLTDAGTAAMRVCAELAEWRAGCEISPR